MLESVGIFQEGVQGLLMSRGELLLMVPDRPAFMSNRENRGNRIGMSRDQYIPIDLGQVVHLFVQDFSPGEGMFLAFLVPSNMLGMQCEGTVLDEMVKAGDQVEAFISGVGDESFLEDVEGADVVTGESKGAPLDLVERADGVDHSKDPNKASQFAAV